MSIGFVGDIHGWLPSLRDHSDQLEGKVSCLIQVGDFGVPAHEIQGWIRKNKGMKVPTYFIDGNHEFFETFYDNMEVTEILPNLYYVPRGTVLNLDGKKIAFLGGAASIDKGYRLRQNLHWDERENILPQEVLRLYENAFKDERPVDILVTHCPPNSVVKNNFDDKGKLAFDVGLDWQDPNMLVVEEVWKKLNYPTMFCGHMHCSVMFDPIKKSRILAEFECIVYPDLYGEFNNDVVDEKPKIEPYVYLANRKE